MYYPAIKQMIQNLEAVEGWLDEAEKFAASKKFNIEVLLNDRLAPDMNSLIYQIQSACDYVKAAAGWLAGQKPPRHEDNEATIDEVRERIRKTIAFARSVSPAQYEAAAGRKIALPWKPGKVLGGEDYLIQIIIPNVYFHLTTTYAILRYNGVDIGKQDFLGAIRFIDGSPE
jgi:hypothetical protein